MITATIVSHRPINFQFHNYFRRKQGLENVLQQLLEMELKRLKVDKVVTGFNYGAERALYRAAKANSLDYLVYMASENEFSLYPDEQKEYVEKLIKSEKGNVAVIGGVTYSPKAIENKMEAAIDCSDIVITLFNGRLGHTLNWLKYANNQNKVVVNLYHVYKRVADTYIQNNFDEYVAYLKQFEPKELGDKEHAERSN